MYSSVMGDNTHKLSVNQSGTTGNTAQVHVPASVQREQGVCIDDVVEVTLFDVNDYVNSASFENQQTAGDKVSVPADFVRSVGLEIGETYPVSFEKVEDVDDEEEQSDAETLLEEMGAEVSGEEEAEEEAEEEEGLAELFG